MKKHINIIIFIILAVIQIAIPVQMVIVRENILNKGKLYKIQVRPVDPYDIFRGRYVAINIEGFDYNNIPVHKRNLLKEGTEFYAILGINKNGYAYIKDISIDKPDEEYLLMENDLNNRIKNPFDRFYMNQEIAPEAEKLYQEYSRDSINHDSKTYITVRIKEGKGTIEDLYINDKPFYQMINNLKEEDK